MAPFGYAPIEYSEGMRATSVLVVAAALLLAGCNDDLSEDVADPIPATPDNAPSIAAAEPAGDDTPTPDVSALKAPAATPAASITIGDQSWSFADVTCTIDGDIVDVTAGGDGLQLHVGTTDGHVASLHDLDDPEDPDVAYEAAWDSGEFVTVEGQQVSGSVEFFDAHSESMETTWPGTFHVTCP